MTDPASPASPEPTPGQTPVPPPPPASPYAAAGPQKPQTVLSLLSMIGGIVGLVLACCFGAGILFSIAAVVLGHLGIRREPARGMAMTGLITGYVGIGIAVIFWILLFAAPFLLVPIVGWTGYGM
jgi:hypothetical protein